MTERNPLVLVGGEVVPLPGGDTIPGSMTEFQKDKLEGIEAGAQKNVGEEFTSAEKTKLGTVLTNAEPNDPLVSQSVAEAGTSVARIGWSSQRIRQAITSWWNGLSVDASKVTSGVFAVGRIPTVNQDTTGRARIATSADKLTTGQQINGTVFDGSAPITTATWGAPRILSFSGDISGSASVNGSAPVTFNLTLPNLGITPGVYTKVTVDAKGRVTTGEALGANDLPANAVLPGNPTSTTQASSDSSSRLATTSFVQTVVAEAALGGGTGGVTPLQVKVLYESNDNTNAFTDAEKAKLGTVQANAQENHVQVSVPEATAGIVTGLRSWSPVLVFTAISAWWAASAFKTKLDSVANGATANSSDADLRNRGTHTGTQTASTISDFNNAAQSAPLAGLGAGSATPIAETDSNIEALAKLQNQITTNTSLVPQSVAEAGTSTTVLGWSSLRIRQSVTAWWNASSMKTKLDGIANGATSNSADATLLNRSNHTGTQPSSTISNFAAAVLDAVLAGFSVSATNSSVGASDTVLSAFGKLQKSINDLVTSVGNKWNDVVADTSVGATPLVDITGKTATIRSLAAGPGIGLTLTGNKVTVDMVAGIPLFTVLWWSNRATIPAGYVALDGQLLSRATYPDALAGIVAGNVPVVADVTWLSTPAERGKYTIGDGNTTFRLADLNGKFAGSLGAVFQRGDGAMSAGTAGAIQQDAMQGHLHNTISEGGSGTAGTNGINTKSGNVPSSPPVTDGINGTPRTAAETRPLNVTGCFVVRLFGAVTNVGSADAAQLATDYANLSSRTTFLENINKPFTKEYVSPLQTLTLAGLLTFTHDLGKAPKIVWGDFSCVTAEAGYAVGDVISQPLLCDFAASAAGYGITLKTNSTQIVARIGNSGWNAGIINATTGAAFTGTPGAWRLTLRAYA